MRIFELGSGPDRFEGGAGVVAIGNFDGVHLGHRQVIRRLIERARADGVPASVLTFEPYPREYFTPDAAPPRLTSCRHKFELLLDAGVDRVYCARFGRVLAATTAEDFVGDILVTRLAVGHVVVGADFRFGKGRAGDVELLSALGRRHGFSVTAVDDVESSGERVSSSRIRELLAKRDLEGAAALLGRPFSFKGRVIHGDKRGRTWGFPTANLAVRRGSFPLAGVFVVELAAEDGFRAFGVANVGRRPTVQGTRLLVEVHLFDVQPDLYGARVEVTFLAPVREERRFENFEALKAQIGRDIDFARAWLGGARDARAGGR